MNIYLKKCGVSVYLIIIYMSCVAPAYALYECVSNDIKSYQDKPCDEKGNLLDNHQKHNQGVYEAIYKKLDILASQGYGLSQRRKPKANPEPSNYVKSLCGEPVSWQVDKAYRRCSKNAMHELTQRKNAKAAANMSRYMEGIKSFCGAKWGRSPQLGMTDEDFRICSSRGNIEQEIVIHEKGVFATLYVLDDVHNNRIYAIDGIVTKIKTTSKNRLFR